MATTITTTTTLTQRAETRPSSFGLRRFRIAGIAALLSLSLTTPGLGRGPTSNERSEAAYQLGSGDVVELRFFGAQELDREARVNASGNLIIPFLGPVRAGGLTLAELEGSLNALLVEKKLMRYPQVSVFVKEYKSKPIFLLGALHKPGQYEISRRVDIIDAVAMAGGLDLERAGRYAYLQRNGYQSRPDGGIRVGNNTANSTKIDLQALFQEGDLSLNLPLKGGDVLQVSERLVRLYYVVGSVETPGAFEFPAGRKLLISQALAKSGGPLRTAKTNDGVLIRYDENKLRQEISVRFSDILKGTALDFPIKENDIIFIPGSGAKSLAYGLLDVIPRTISGMIIWGP